MRWLWLALLVFISGAYFIKAPLQVKLSPEAQMFYDTIEGLDGTKPVLLMSDWDQGTIGELQEQFYNVVRHLFRKNQRFVIVSGNAVGRPFYEKAMAELGRECGKEYGKDWIACGFKLPDPKGISIEAISRDFVKQVQKDDRGMVPNKYSWLKNVRVADDWSLVISISYSEFREYITYFYQTARTPYICGVASITSTPLFSLINGGQLNGMLVGARGGAMYEQKMDRNAFGTKFLFGQAAGHLMIIVALVLGNLGLLAKIITAKRETKSA